MFGAPHEGVAKGNKESIGGEKRTFRAKPKTIHIPQPTISGVLKVVCMPIWKAGEILKSDEDN